jgi:putative ABC transport system substrate-binding protein
MKKIILLFLIFIPLFLFPQEKKQSWIMIMDSQDSEPYKTVRESMLTELKKLGFYENENLLISYFNLGNYEGAGINTLKSNLPLQNYKVIFVNGTIASLSAKNYIFNDSKYNVVFANVTDPVGLGIIKSFNQKPEFNFTDIAYPVSVEERLRFLKKVFPSAKKIGLVYADMPQSISYNQWLIDALKKPEFKDIEIIFSKVDFVKSEGGYKRMVQISIPTVKELSQKVDVFLSPNDQLGSQDDYATMIFENSTKPLIGLAGEKGCTVSYGPDLEKNGKELALMVKKILEGASIKDIFPTNAKPKIYIDQEKVKKFKMAIPAEYKK